MIQWIGVAVAILGFLWNGVKDFQKGDIKLPTIQKHLTPVKYPVQYCLMAYDPNLDKVFYLHDNGQWYDFAPQIRKYQNQNQESVGNVYGTQGGQVQYNYGQPPQASAYPQRY